MQAMKRMVKNMFVVLALSLFVVGAAYANSLAIPADNQTPSPQATNPQAAECAQLRAKFKEVPNPTPAAQAAADEGGKLCTQGKVAEGVAKLKQALGQ
jgi:hypothetical protein